VSPRFHRRTRRLDRNVPHQELPELLKSLSLRAHISVANYVARKCRGAHFRAL